MPCLCRSPREFFRNRLQHHQSLGWLQQPCPFLHYFVFKPTSPAFLAAIANALQQVLSVQQVPSFRTCSLPESEANSGGVSAPSANSSQLAAQASSFAASGTGFASFLPATATPPALGKPNNCVVPTFASTFSTPIPSLAHSASPSTLNVTLPLSIIGATSLALLPVLHQPFMVLVS